MWVTSSLTNALTPTTVALGNFDGIHLGHQEVIRPILHRIKSQEAETCVGGSDLSKVSQTEVRTLLSYPLSVTADTQQALPSSDRPEHVYSTVVTFNPHPQEFFTGKKRSLLTPVEEKVQQLQALGVEQLVRVPFTRDLASLSPQDFVERILIQQLCCQAISVGENFCFGKQRCGTAKDLQAIAASFGIPVTIVPIHARAGDRISSSAIRQALEHGDLQRAQELLGRPYTLTGTVVQGQQLGRTIGFPTANVAVPPEKFLPGKGVYAVQVFIQGADSYQGVMNIGIRPTVNGTHPSVEVYLFDWSGDLYNQTLTVQLEKFLRPEQKFASLDELKAQIQLDCTAAKEALQGNNK
ncbi:bifunctional riboflavin kinase/FAD synthetase [Gloeocapsopsis dulcis]|uniref:Riboflavin biosynthesis protein n=1 Tax=Gloeocapsopsis dulcis AAB1 = 1H9 TaxID=1433147 RepID=A0A6N8FT79_9CHRO|nr:bifunctional riboflavin kinase/FAD synthetase [Gloeocapsopsis dulcis]MUL36303.1 riboflavin biosynthesis protein RibF [Gloeocapsopsis dulcis AAB1 = 1H9]WNN89587.1 bifunctional riboflavin kinase/FAD synthetase [Gloeocapsopsis dulcis]